MLTSELVPAHRVWERHDESCRVACQASARRIGTNIAVKSGGGQERGWACRL